MNSRLVMLLIGAVTTLTLMALAQPAGAQTGTISFGQAAALQGETSTNPTSLQFGPDGRLYVAQQNGLIKVYTVKRNAADDYSATSTETINVVQKIPNHNDNGSVNTAITTRQVTGILAAGTAANPVIYVSSSDPRIGGGSTGEDKNLDTNSGIISRLTWNGSGWAKQDLVRGLPRSEENHSVNGMQLSGGTLYVTVGGNTNQGASSNNFALLPEFALSTAVLSIDLGAIGNTTYDLPTLDDGSRTNVSAGVDQGDPFGGNDGNNQAKLVSGGPVQIYATGFRNAYDLVIADSGKMYTIDNGGNAGWGDKPKGVNTPSCTNEVSEPGATNQDNFHHVSSGYYGGHPNPTRANKANTFGGQSPVEVAADPVECNYQKPASNTLTTFPASTNGIDEYTASNFGGAMKGNLLTASFNGTIYRLLLDDTGTALASKEPLFQNFGTTPLDVTAQGDNDPFPGTVWAATYGSDEIIAFEPVANQTCDTSNPDGDADGDGYTNSDEQASGTDPCSAGDVPPDYDNDKVSNKNDPDDDNDGTPDTSDPFALDPNNGKTATLPVRYTWDPGAPNPGGLEGYFGFTGLMTNGTSDYASLYDPNMMTVGGAAGAFTVDEVPEGDALKANNNQKYGFQTGVNVGPTSGVFTAHARVLAPFAGITPQDYQSMGLHIGTGDQDNYAKLVVSANGGLEFAKEVGGTFSSKKTAASVLGSDFVDLYLTVDPAAGKVQPSYTVTTNGQTGSRTNLGTPVAIPAGWVDGTGALAAGFISSSKGPAPPFAATWDFIEIVSGDGGGEVDLPGQWQDRAPSSTNRQEVSYVESGGKLYLTGGTTLHEAYNPQSNSWSTVKPLPEKLDHIQGVELGGKIYYIGGLSSWPGPHTSVVYIYDSKTDTFNQGAPMPRGRGAGGVAAYGGKIYYAGGLHDGVAVPWFDVYDPATDSWKQLPDMPRARDHFHASVVDGKFYAIGGRNKDINATITANDAYNFSAGSWQAGLAPLPTPRGGFATAVLGKEILVIGGEGGGVTYSEVEAYNTATDNWRKLEPMPTARHGIQAAVCDGGVYIPAGGTKQGAGGATNKHEVFFLGAATECKPPPEDTTPPTVTGKTPADGATSVAVGTNVTATFSEEMDPATINGNTFTLAEQGGPAVSSTVSYDATNKKATLKPGTDLKTNTTYVAKVSTAAKDLAGNALASAETWSFTTASSGSSYGLQVSAQADRASPVALEGATASGNIYVFTAPDAGVSQVAFWLDDPNMAGKVNKVERQAPYDFAGGTVSTAKPFDTTKVADGAHTITAKVTLTNGTTEVVSSTFSVKNAS